ncbi:S24 family peptidase [Chitinophaga sedimenti]|uniref:LexA family protein n=1 Tax=Chitinophaga sedimenti TaxID=2033606 RepID=UPI00200555A2|nr:S24 family peptidase [Chitinophaga sedimenti]MCK7555790.1 S24 family peptidase [Chitinophaga sedimenti]
MSENEKVRTVHLYSIKDTPCTVTALNTKVKAGFPSPAADYLEEDINLAEHLRLTSPNMYLMQVDGDSMADAYLPHGSYIVVERGRKAHSQEIVVAVYNGGFTVKRFVKSASGYLLYSANAMYEPIVVKGDDELEIWGVVTRVIIDPNRGV